MSKRKEDWNQTRTQMKNNLEGKILILWVINYESYCMTHTVW